MLAWARTKDPFIPLCGLDALGLALHYETVFG